MNTVSMSHWRQGSHHLLHYIHVVMRGHFCSHSHGHRAEATEDGMSREGHYNETFPQHFRTMITGILFLGDFQKMLFLFRLAEDIGGLGS